MQSASSSWWCIFYCLKSPFPDFNLFNQELSILGRNELRIFRDYLSGEKDIAEIADEEGIQYESVAQKVRRAKVKIKVQMVGFLEGIIQAIRGFGL